MFSSVAVRQVGLGPRRSSPRDTRDRRECVRTEVLAHVSARNVPDGKEDTLALVVARTVLVGRPEVSECDGPVHCRDHVGQLDVVGIAGENVSTADAALGLHDSGTFECEENLFEVGLWKCGAFRNVANGRGSRLVGVQNERQQRPTGIIPSRRHSHTVIVGGGL